MVPTRLFFTKGVGRHIHKLQSFELALRDAGIEKQNLVRVSSIYPTCCKIIPVKDGQPKLKPGQITDSLPIYDMPGPGRKIQGYVIYKLISREAAGQRDLNDPRVQQSIRQSLRDRKAQLLQNAYFEMLHDQAALRNYFAEQILKEGTP